MSLLLNTPSTYRKNGIYYLQRYASKDVRSIIKPTGFPFRLEQNPHVRPLLWLGLLVQSLKPNGILLSSLTQKCTLST